MHLHRGVGYPLSGRARARAARSRRHQSTQFSRALFPAISLASLMFPKVFPKSMKTAPGEISEGRFA